MRTKFIALAALAAAAAPANAATVFSDNFNSENSGFSQLNYTGFANWSVGGQVDLVKSGDYNITCAGSCVDLDGTTGPGSINLLNAINYGAGQIVTVYYLVGGSQRVANALDDFYANIITTSNGVLVGPPPSITSSDPFVLGSVSFLASAAGSLTLSFGTTSHDDIGPLLDGVAVDVSDVTAAVPEPATWAMMLAGFGLVGGAMRRRTRTAVSFA